MSARLVLWISYNGSGFLGYARQPHGPTAQGSLTEAWRVFTGETAELSGCSRLDAGVHAHRYCLHLGTAFRGDLGLAVQHLNGILRNHLGVGIRVLGASWAEESFHARFSAAGKHYRYLVWHGRGEHALLTPRCWHLRTPRPQPEDWVQVFRLYEGTHDFARFRGRSTLQPRSVAI